MVNPHGYVYFDVTTDGETVNWRCETTAGSLLKQRGFTKDTFAVGSKIIVNGNPARREDNHCYASSFVLADGTKIGRNDSIVAKSPQQAEEKNAQQNRPEKLANGQPNLQGPWVSKSFGRRGAEGIRPSFEATEAGKKAAAGYEMSFDDPILTCHVVNIFNGWNHDMNVNDIIQKDDVITMQYGFMDFVRTIHLDMKEHPENITPSTGGHSIGWFEDDVLVIDTIGFNEGVLNHQNGMKHSPQMHTVERIYFDDKKQRLIRDYSVTDPLYLKGETKGQDLMALADKPYAPYNCVELSGKNNIRSPE
jgi:sulfur carrier protein ThiS